MLLFVLVANGALFGEDPRRFARMLIVTFGLGAFLCVLFIKRVNTHDSRGLASQTTLVTALTMAAATWGLVGLVFPSTPASAITPPCPGVPVTGGGVQVQTRGDGVNVRSEPSITADQVGRLGGNCSIAVDGYCLGGTPLHDAVSDDLVDVRWFRLHRIRGWDEFAARWFSGGADEERFVAAATITSFVTDQLVHRLTKQECKTATPVPSPGPAKLERNADVIDKNGVAQASFVVTADNTFEFGVSLLMLGEVRTGNPYRKITNWTRPDDVSLAVLWNTSATSRYISKPTKVVLFGGRCYSIGAPMKVSAASAALLAYTLTPDGKLSSVPVPELDGSQLKELAATACREDTP